MPGDWQVKKRLESVKQLIGDVPDEFLAIPENNGKDLEFLGPTDHEVMSQSSEHKRIKEGWPK